MNNHKRIEPIETLDEYFKRVNENNRYNDEVEVDIESYNIGYVNAIQAVLEQFESIEYIEDVEKLYESMMMYVDGVNEGKIGDFIKRNGKRILGGVAAAGAAYGIAKGVGRVRDNITLGQAANKDAGKQTQGGIKGAWQDFNAGRDTRAFMKQGGSQTINWNDHNGKQQSYTDKIDPQSNKNIKNHAKTIRQEMKARNFVKNNSSNGLTYSTH